MRAPTCGRPSGDRTTPSSEGGGGLEGKQPWSWSRTHYIWSWISNAFNSLPTEVSAAVFFSPPFLFSQCLERLTKMWWQAASGLS